MSQNNKPVTSPQRTDLGGIAVEPKAPSATEMVERFGINLKAITELHRRFSEMDNSPTVLSLQEFRQFAPLFQRNAQMDNGTRQYLSDQYFQRINMYQPVHIAIDPANPETVVLRLPQLFVSANTLTDDKSAELAAVNAMLNQKSDRNDIRSRAYQQYSEYFLENQVNDAMIARIGDARETTEEIIDEFLTRITQIANGETPEPIKAAAPAAAVTTQEFSDDDDIPFIDPDD